MSICLKDPLGCKFLKQKPIGRFIADFYCSKLLLIIEIDGGVHENRKNYDEGRDFEMLRRGIKTIRYTDTQVMDDFGMVTRDIDKVLKASLPQGR
jgi:very-short-patch-repair endonuclease